MRASLILLTACLACTQSRLDPNSPVTVSGFALHQDGRPLVDHKVALIKDLNAVNAVTDLTWVASTLALPCLSENPPASCKSTRTTRTAANGTFSFSMTGADTQTANGIASTFHLVVQDAARGPSAHQQFQIQDEKLVVPELRLWEPTVVVNANPTSVTLSFDAVPQQGFGRNPVSGISFVDDDGLPLWSQARRGGEALDARLFEDFRGHVLATATSSQPGPGSVWWFHFRSTQQPFLGPAGAPPSRGRPCAIHGAPQLLQPCPITDGDITTALQPVPEDCSGSNCEQAAVGNNWVQVDMGELISLNLVVVRGLSTPCFVETSADAVSWMGVSGVTPQQGSFSVLVGRVPARYVRLRADGQRARITALNELSVW